jgi:hypothetical protein
MSFKNEQEDNATIIWLKIHKYKKEWLRILNKRGAYYEKANRRVFQINSYHMNEADKTIFKGFKIKSLSKGKVLFFRSSILYKGF